MISHRGISVITPLPFGGGEGGGANWKLVCEVTPFGLLLIGNGPLNIWRTCRGISVITPLSIRRGAGGEARTCPSSSENMPFLHVEDVLLGARRACSQTPSVTF